MADRIILEEKANKIVYREGHTIVKEFTPSHPKANVFNEAYIHACVESCGVPSPKIISVGPAEGGWALTMEYVEGKTLDQLMKEAPEKIGKDGRVPEQAGGYPAGSRKLPCTAAAQYPL